jgi:hypothetical protein
MVTAWLTLERLLPAVALTPTSFFVPFETVTLSPAPGEQELSQIDGNGRLLDCLLVQETIPRLSALRGRRTAITFLECGSHATIVGQRVYVATVAHPRRETRSPRCLPG